MVRRRREGGKIGRGEEGGRGEHLLVYCGQDEKYRRVTIDIIPCVVVTSLETDAFMAIVACFDMLIIEEGARSRRRRYSRSSCYSEKKKKVQGCVSQN